MSHEVIVHKGRTNVLPVNLGFDVSGDTFTSQIRTQPSQDSTLIAEWTVTFATDGTDGKLILRLDNSVTSLIAETAGYMDLKRINGSEPIAVFDKPLEVLFQGSVTV